MTYNDNGKQITSFDASYWKQFKIKLFTLTIPTIEILKNRYPHLYNNYSWTCPNEVTRMEYKTDTQITVRCQNNESLDHVFLCEAVKHVMRQIMENLILRITSDLRSIHPKKITKRLLQQLSELPYFNINLQSDSDINVTQFIQGFIPNSLFNFLKKFGCNASEIERIICSNLSWLVKEIHEKIWIPRCKKLQMREAAVNILPEHKKKGNQRRINVNNLTFLVIQYLDSTLKQHCENDLWNIWIEYSCQTGKPWQDF